MKAKRRRLPQVVGPLETLDSRITPATGVSLVPAPGVLLGPFVPGQSLVGSTQVLPSMGVLRSFPGHLTVTRPLGSFMLQNGQFMAPGANLFSNNFVTVSPGFGVARFGVGQQLLISNAVLGSNLRAVSRATGISIAALRTSLASAARFHGRIIVPTSFSDSGLRPFLPNFGGGPFTSAQIPFLIAATNPIFNPGTGTTTTTATAGLTAFNNASNGLTILGTTPLSGAMGAM